MYFNRIIWHQSIGKLCTKASVGQSCDFVLILTEYKKKRITRVLLSMTKSTFNPPKPIGFYTYHQAPHSTILHGARFALGVLCGTQNSELRTFALYIISWLVFITVVKSVYSAVRTDSLYKADYVWSFKSYRSRDAPAV